ncbi:MAG TPA: response regulator transcription factor [Gaiellaceae bacterium]|nr:response regulator transcription factor [Gaiellaceae bacterium]
MRRSPLRVLLVDDQPLFLETLALLLGGDERVLVVGSAHDGLEAVRLAQDLAPDLVLMDLDMPVLDGVEATVRILATLPTASVVIVSGSDCASDVDRARRAGAAGYVTKSRLAIDLESAIAAAALSRGRGCKVSGRAASLRMG